MLRIVAALLVALAAAVAQPLPDEFFESKIRPLLVEHCQPCHSTNPQAGLRLDSRDTILQGGRSGPAVVPGDPDASLLIRVISHTHERIKMPPNRKLIGRQIDDFRAWIQLGAPWPAPKPADLRSVRITDSQRRFWAWQPIPPSASSIDQLVAARLAAAGLRPAPRADQRTLIRRLSFDLTGLPPKPEEVDAFLADRSPNAYAKLVDRLLASPAFGERWARHWLDIARYSEDDVLGLSQESYANAWRYRDWVVEAFNRDLPYSMFVKAQLAADQLEVDSSFDLRGGLGFLGLGPWYYATAPPPQARADERHDRVDVVTRGFLGLTGACARCHDHKFDPITMRDYYALAGVFASTEYREIPLVPAAQVDAWDQQQQRLKDAEKALKDFAEQQSRSTAERLALDLNRYRDAAARREPAGLDPALYQRFVDYLNRKKHDHSFLKTAPDLQALLAEVLAEKNKIDAENEALLPKPKPGASKTRLPNGFTTYDDFCPGCDVATKSIERDRYMLWRDFYSPWDVQKKSGGVLMFPIEELPRYLAEPDRQKLAQLQADVASLKRALPERYAYLHTIGDKENPANLKIHLRGSPYNLGDEQPRRFLEVLGGAPLTTGSGRLQLADAILAQPITARVAANRIWGQLLGSYLVNTPSNFGRLGEKPSNPALLEHLAHRLVANGWSQKKLIREIVLSDTYQRSADGPAANATIDEGNKLYWRAHRRRLDAEQTRDAVLAVAGSLDAKLGGPSIDLTKDRTRRTLYGKISRFRLDPMLPLFDFPSPAITSEKRNVTLVPLQRLYFLNSSLVEDSAAALATRADGSISTAYRLLFSRDATAAERASGEAFIAAHGWPRYAQVLLATNEFTFLD